MLIGYLQCLKYIYSSDNLEKVVVPPLKGVKVNITQ